MTVRAKFKVVSLSRQIGWGVNPEVHTVRLQPVTSGSKENEQFYAATPGGQIEVLTVKPGLFDLGKEYYVDFTLAE